jgi:hypothetical protein
MTERELTNAQLAQQDFVDNTIWDMLKELTFGKLDDNDYDVGLVGPVRDVIQAEFAERGITSKQEFYPEVEG